MFNPEEWTAEESRVQQPEGDEHMAGPVVAREMYIHRGTSNKPITSTLRDMAIYSKYSVR